MSNNGDNLNLHENEDKIKEEDIQLVQELVFDYFKSKANQNKKLKENEEEEDINQLINEVINYNSLEHITYKDNTKNIFRFKNVVKKDGNVFILAYNKKTKNDELLDFSYIAQIYPDKLFNWISRKQISKLQPGSFLFPAIY